MENDLDLFSLVDSVNLLLLTINRLDQALRSSRLELSFSRSHRGSLTGASFAYVPRTLFMSKVRVRIRDGKAELINVNVRKELALISEVVQEKGGLRFRNLRSRNKGESKLEGKKCTIRDNDDKNIGDDDNDFVDGLLERSDPLSWFGENSSPSILSGKARFETVLRLCLETINIRTCLQQDQVKDNVL